jgi:hypothetical protein
LDRFIWKIKADLRERVTNFEDVWSIMFLSSDKQAVAESAARVAQEIVSTKDDQIVKMEQLIDQLHAEIRDLRAQIEEERIKISKLNTHKCENI